MSDKKAPQPMTKNMPPADLNKGTPAYRPPVRPPAPSPSTSNPAGGKK